MILLDDPNKKPSAYEIMYNVVCKHLDRYFKNRRTMTELLLTKEQEFFLEADLQFAVKAMRELPKTEKL